MKTIKPMFFIALLAYLLTSAFLIAEVDQYDLEAYDYFLEEEREKSLQLLEALEQKVPSPTFSANTKSSTVRILPLGDSITFGIYIGDTRDDSLRHSYRNHLWYKLRDAGYSVNFVGTRNTGWNVSPSFDGHNDGYPGLNTYEVGAKMSSILSATHPDIILLHLGTNDKSTSIAGLNSLLNKIDTYEANNNHHITVVLARIIGATNIARHAQIAGFNSNLVSLANSRKNNGDDIVVVNMYSGAGIHYDSRDMIDYLHPTNSGQAKMATVWFNALKNILSTANPIPTQPSSFHTTSITHNSVTLSWSDNSNNETSFKIYNSTTTHTTTLNANTTQYTLNNLQPNTSYTLAIASSNSNGNSDPSYITFTTDPIPIPSAPSNAGVSALETSSAVLQWQDNSTYESGFKIYADNVHIATVGNNVTQYPLSNLITRTAYTYSVTAYNSSGESSSSSVSFTTKDDYGWLPAVYHAVLN